MQLAQKLIYDDWILNSPVVDFCICGQHLLLRGEKCANISSRQSSAEVGSPERGTLGQGKLLDAQCDSKERAFNHMIPRPEGLLCVRLIGATLQEPISEVLEKLPLRIIVFRVDANIKLPPCNMPKNPDIFRVL
jgi:hypothetical protein